MRRRRGRGVWGGWKGCGVGSGGCLGGARARLDAAERGLEREGAGRVNAASAPAEGTAEASSVMASSSVLRCTGVGGGERRRGEAGEEGEEEETEPRSAPSTPSILAGGVVEVDVEVEEAEDEERAGADWAERVGKVEEEGEEVEAAKVNTEAPAGELLDRITGGHHTADLSPQRQPIQGRMKGIRQVQHPGEEEEREGAE